MKPRTNKSSHVTAGPKIHISIANVSWGAGQTPEGALDAMSAEVRVLVPQPRPARRGSWRWRHRAIATCRRLRSSTLPMWSPTIGLACWHRAARPSSQNSMRRRQRCRGDGRLGRGSDRTDRGRNRALAQGRERDRRQRADRVALTPADRRRCGDRGAASAIRRARQASSSAHGRRVPHSLAATRRPVPWRWPRPRLRRASRRRQAGEAA